jgi:hypothetical protein
VCLYDACGLLRPSGRLQRLGFKPSAPSLHQSPTIECTAQLCWTRALDCPAVDVLGTMRRVAIQLTGDEKNAKRGFEKVWVGRPL